MLSLADKKCVPCDDPNIPKLTLRVKILGINKWVHLHLFRHTWITEDIRANLPTDKIMKISGHSSFQTHLRYTHLVGEDCKDAMDKHPLNKDRKRKEIEVEATKESSLASLQQEPS